MDKKFVSFFYRWKHNEFTEEIYHRKKERHLRLCKSKPEGFKETKCLTCGKVFPTFSLLNDLSSDNNNEFHKGDIEYEADNSTEESINVESRLFHEDTIETINEEIETVEESNDESKVGEIEKEKGLGYIIK